MVNPKKDYELLMQYLQGAPQKEPAASKASSSLQPKWEPDVTSGQPTFRARAVPKTRIHFYTKYTRPFRLLIAVVAMAVFGFLASQAITLYRLTPERLFNQLYTPFTALVPTPAKNSIEAYYAAGNVVATTLQSKRQQTFTDRERFLTGLAYLQRADYSNSIKWLEPAAANYKSAYRQQAQYYLALVYLKNGDFDRSIEMAERISRTTGHPYQRYFSKNVLTDIKMLKWK